MASSAAKKKAGGKKGRGAAKRVGEQTRARARHKREDAPPPPPPADDRKIMVGDWIKVRQSGLEGRVKAMSRNGERVCVRFPRTATLAGYDQHWSMEELERAPEPPAAPAAGRRRAKDTAETVARLTDVLDEEAPPAPLGVVTGEDGTLRDAETNEVLPAPGTPVPGEDAPAPAQAAAPSAETPAPVAVVAAPRPVLRFELAADLPLILGKRGDEIGRATLTTAGAVVVHGRCVNGHKTPSDRLGLCPVAGCGATALTFAGRAPMRNLRDAMNALGATKGSPFWLWKFERDGAQHPIGSLLPGHAERHAQHLAKLKEKRHTSTPIDKAKKAVARLEERLAEAKKALAELEAAPAPGAA
jgi:hypothetical protein